MHWESTRSGTRRFWSPRTRPATAAAVPARHNHLSSGPMNSRPHQRHHLQPLGLPIWMAARRHCQPMQSAVGGGQWIRDVASEHRRRVSQETPEETHSTQHTAHSTQRAHHTTRSNRSCDCNATLPPDMLFFFLATVIGSWGAIFARAVCRHQSCLLQCRVL